MFFVFQPIYGFCLVRCSACALHLLLCFRSTHIVWFDPSIVTFVPTVCIRLWVPALPCVTSNFTPLSPFLGWRLRAASLRATLLGVIPILPMLILISVLLAIFRGLERSTSFRIGPTSLVGNHARLAPCKLLRLQMLTALSIPDLSFMLYLCLRIVFLRLFCVLVASIRLSPLCGSSWLTITRTISLIGLMTLWMNFWP